MPVEIATLEIRPVDVSVLRLQEGDVLVAHLDDSWFPEGEEATHDTVLEVTAAALKGALENAGLEKVGSLITVGNKIEFTIVRTQEDPDA